MEVLRSIPQETVATLYIIFHYIELGVLAFGFVIATTFMSQFIHLQSVHINLRLILGSFILSACITSVWRVCCCFLRLGIIVVDHNEETVNFMSDMRKASIYATSLHMILLAAERQLATIRSKTYESERNITHVIILIAGSWGFSLGVVYSLKAFVARDFVVALLYSAVFMSAIVWMMRVRKINVAKWKGHRGTLQFSQSYQVRENVTSATFLYKCFVIYSVQVVFSWFCALIHLASRDVIKVPIIEKTFGFIFDIVVALASTTLPLSIIRYNEKSRKQFRWLLRKIGASKTEENAQSFVDFEGKQTKIKAADESSIYFNQLKEAWS